MCTPLKKLKLANALIKHFKMIKLLLRDLQKQNLPFPSNTSEGGRGAGFCDGKIGIDTSA
jgi:hypothetical protein